MRAKKENVVKITKDMRKTKAFSDSVDGIISAENEILGFTIGTALFMTLYIALQFIPVANWVGNTGLFIITLVTGGGITKDSLNLAKSMINYFRASQDAKTSFKQI